MSIRHDSVKYKLAHLIRESGRQVQVEKKDVLDDGTNKRPADVFVHHWDLDMPLCIDVAVISGTSNQTIETKEAEKRRKYLVDCENRQIKFEPFIMDSHGRMGKTARSILKKLSYGYAEKHCIEVSVASERLRLIIAQAMVREQSAQIIARLI